MNKAVISVTWNKDHVKWITIPTLLRDQFPAAKVASRPGRRVPRPHRHPRNLGRGLGQSGPPSLLQPFPGTHGNRADVRRQTLTRLNVLVGIVVLALLPVGFPPYVVESGGTLVWLPHGRCLHCTDALAEGLKGNLIIGFHVCMAELLKNPHWNDSMHEAVDKRRLGCHKKTTKN